MRLVIISGISGSGKSIALNLLEDRGYYCIDNIPAALFRSFIEQSWTNEDETYANTAVGLDARNRPDDIESIPELVEKLKTSGSRCEILFLTADDDILIKRYSETRRRHPLSDSKTGLREAIRAERELLAPVADAADLVIDTSRTSVHELRELIRHRIAEKDDGGMSILFQSFAYKHGVPADADFVFDVRCLPNPYWEISLRQLTGRDQPVAEFLSAHDAVTRMLDSITGFLDQWIPDFEKSNRSYLTIAIGCTGGHHRSVFLVEQLYARYSANRQHVIRRHSELDG